MVESVETFSQRHNKRKYGVWCEYECRMLYSHSIYYSLSLNYRHAGCECTPGWEGPHCAHRAGTFPQTPQEVEKKDKVAFSVFGLAVALYILGTVWFYNRKRRRRQQQGNRSSPTRSRSIPKRSNIKNNKLDYDAFLDEYEGSNDYREGSSGEHDSSFDLRSYKSKELQLL